MWECPTIEHIGGKDVLMFCPQHLLIPGRGNSRHHNGYIIGNMDWDKLEFQPEGQFHVLDFGFDSYAAACANNIQDSDKAILIAWMGLPDASYPTDEEDWSGCLTLPRELTVRGRRLIQKPLPEIRKLRDERVVIENDRKGLFKLPKAIEMEVDCREGLHYVRLFTDENGEGGLRISCDAAQTEISVDRSGLRKRFNTEDGEVRTRPLEHGLTHLRIFIDSSSVEVFVNDGDAVFTSRVFPDEGELYCNIQGDSFVKMWTMKRAVREQFLV
jgi:beta-fructofuranosidase